MALETKTEIIFWESASTPHKNQYVNNSLPPFFINLKLALSPKIVKKTFIKKGVILFIICMFDISNIISIVLKRVKSNPPMTGAGIQNLLKKLILNFKVEPISKNVIQSIKVKVKSKLISINISPP